ncbi:MAG: hypothetical protein E6J90_49515 [Deltaproteobacteria bacterium]|nr:MAG: hypothetical protein E6J90_49515 [Deltaproteobacteria bacterium]TMQ08320.1 MAG: hypothetical protein E6J91_33440 [Deltaproteobacteria bacterium]
MLDIGAYEYSSTGCSYAISPASVAASAAGGSANVTVMAGAGCSWTATGNVTWVTITAGASGTGNGSVTYTVAANTGAARSGTLTIAGQTFTISQAAATTCQSAGTLDWIHGGYPTQTGIFTAEYDATPSVTPIDAVVGLSSGVQTAYTGLAAITSFDVSGYLYARNGSTYQHITTIAYAAGSTYHFRLVVDRGAHTYSAYVQVNGGVEQTLAINYAFRSEQATVGQLDTWNATTETTNATIQVCNVAITPPPRSSLADFYIDQTSVTFPGGNVGDHAAIAPEGLGGSNAVKYTNLQTWDGTPQIHLAAPLDISSVQSTDSLRISLDVSAGRTSSMYIYFNDDWKTYLVSPVLDQTGGYQTFDIPIGSTMRSQMTNSINDIYFKAGDGFPDNGTLWVDEIRFIRP